VLGGAAGDAGLVYLINVGFGVALDGAAVSGAAGFGDAGWLDGPDGACKATCGAVGLADETRFNTGLGGAFDGPGGGGRLGFDCSRNAVVLNDRLLPRSRAWV